MEDRNSFALFWVVTCCGLFSSFIPAVVKVVLHILSRETELETNLRRQVSDLKAEIGGINMVDEFAKYAKIQRKISKASDELSHQAQIRSTYSLKVRIGATGILYAAMALTIIYLIWNYSEVPVVVYPSEWLFPIGSVLSLPSEIEGGIGITPWLFITSSVGRLMVKYIV